MCDPGYEDPDGDGNCTECSVGTYKSGLGNEACGPCAVNKTTNSTGKTDISSCGRFILLSLIIAFKQLKEKVVLWDHLPLC